MAPGDPISAVILGSAVSNDGGYSPFMTPSVEGQRAVLKEAYLKARVSPGSVHYVEAHGTGTRVGDPVEAASLSSVVGEGRPEGQPCFIGSCKTNIGHLEAAAGVAELIKAALSVKHGVIPPSLHCENPNPEIPWADYRLAVQRDAAPWPESDGPRLAGVNSFGISGTNAHVVLEEAPRQPFVPAASAASPGAVRLLPLSAHTKESLRAFAGALKTELEQSKDDLGDVCYPVFSI